MTGFLVSLVLLSAVSLLFAMLGKPARRHLYIIIGLLYYAVFGTLVLLSFNDVFLIPASPFFSIFIQILIIFSILYIITKSELSQVRLSRGGKLYITADGQPPKRSPVVCALVIYAIILMWNSTGATDIPAFYKAVMMSHPAAVPHIIFSMAAKTAALAAATALIANEPPAKLQNCVFAHQVGLQTPPSLMGKGAGGMRPKNRIPLLPNGLCVPLLLRFACISMAISLFLGMIWRFEAFMAPGELWTWDPIETVALCCMFCLLMMRLSLGKAAAWPVLMCILANEIAIGGITKTSSWHAYTAPQMLTTAYFAAIAVTMLLWRLLTPQFCSMPRGNKPKTAGQIVRMACGFSVVLVAVSIAFGAAFSRPVLTAFFAGLAVVMAVCYFRGIRKRVAAAAAALLIIGVNYINVWPQYNFVLPTVSQTSAGETQLSRYYPGGDLSRAELVIHGSPCELSFYENTDKHGGRREMPVGRCTILNGTKIWRVYAERYFFTDGLLTFFADVTPAVIWLALSLLAIFVATWGGRKPGGRCGGTPPHGG